MNAIRNHPCRAAGLMLLVFLMGTLPSCQNPSAPATTSAAKPVLRITLDVSNTTIASVVAQVTGPDFDTITVNLQMDGNTATGTVEIPAGSNRVLTIHAYDAQGVETHRGQTTLTIREGVNGPVTVVLEPLTGEQEITAVLGQIFVTIVERPDTMTVGAEAGVAAVVTDVSGDTLTQRVQWGSLTPEVAKVDTSGVVTALDSGQARLVAVYSGVATETAFAVVTARQQVDVWLTTAFKAWFQGSYSYSGPGLFLSNQSFQHTAPWSNAGMEYYGRIPRNAIVNDPADAYYVNISYPWVQSYKVIQAVNAGLSRLPALTANGSVTADEALRYRAFAAFTEGMAYATVAALYDKGFILDQGADSTSSDLFGYATVMDTALAYFDQAITLCGQSSFTLPNSWMSVDNVTVDNTLLAQIAHSEEARYMAAVARTPAERKAVDWAKVESEVDAGVTSTFSIFEDSNNGWGNSALFYGSRAGWAEMPYWIYGMADQDGNYQRWLAQPIDSMSPDPSDGDIVIVTPDNRFPRGATIADQRDNPGRYIDAPSDIGGVWAHPERGTWRWSYYFNYRFQAYDNTEAEDIPEIPIEEMNLLKAEGLYYSGDLAGAAAIINQTRVPAGLNATDASGTNTSCVPKLPDGSCGDLWEMLKWEKRMEMQFTGLLDAPWWFDSRGWGDLWKDTPLEFPVPCKVLQTLQILPCYTFGGSGGNMSAATSTYNYPGEG